MEQLTVFSQRGDIEPGGNELEFLNVTRDECVTAQEHAYQNLRSGLMIGAIEPGRPVTIREISSAMNLSPTPVREALRRLSSEHALAVLENRRIVVPEMTVSRFRELLSLRATLESYAAKRAVPYINKVLMDELRDIDARLDLALQHDNYPACVILNQKFHSRIYLANPEQVIMPMIESLWLQLGPFLKLAAKYSKEQFLPDRHKEVISALQRRDALAVGFAIDADVKNGLCQLGSEVVEQILQ